MSGKAVIIGAGQTGRGFIAPFIEKSKYNYCFVDKDKSLVERLSKKSSYDVKYYNEEKSPLTIENKKYYYSESDAAKEVISEADFIITAIGSDNIKDIIPLLSAGIKLRSNNEENLSILLCENGIDTKQPLTEARIDANISEAVIFATTLQSEENSLDLYTEDYPNIPYDASVQNIVISVDEFVPEDNFSNLIQRKIYTYNFLSAVVSYLGYYKGYKYLSEAAYDRDIELFVERSIKPLNRAISIFYAVGYKEQQQFSELAIKKFKNKEIVDTISRNIRDTARKLGPTERLVQPLKMSLTNKESIEYILIVIGAAIYYGEYEENLSISNAFKIMGIESQPKLVQKITNAYNLFLEGYDLHEILERSM